MSSYVGKHAGYYDIFYQDKPYAKEAACVHQLLQKFSQGDCKRLLELACGTGSHALELEKLGYEIVATDYSEDLLAIARRKAKEANSRVDLRFQDMRELSLPDMPFDAAYCLFDSIGYVQTNEGIRQVLNRVHAHLREGGLFLFEFWHAAAMLINFEPVRERRWSTAGGELVRRAATRLDVPRQLAIVTYDIDERGKNGDSGVIHETQINRYFLVQEMAAFLENSHFEPLEFFPGYEDGPINENTWHVLAAAQRN
ncbi:MAG TPA: class I SAM-dependent methyltransferase [Anaerolineales bacterium]|nr:class I SAM-dependent methyltransferase [Anaerolineales bacterium]